MASIGSDVGEASPLAMLLRRSRARLLVQWENEARKLPKARPLSGPALLDHVPQLVDELVGVLELGEAGAEELRLASRLSEIHAIERLDEGYDLDEVAGEFALLRELIFRLSAEENVSPSIADVISLNRALDAAIARSAHSYARARERAIRALDRITEAALVADGAEAFLPRLLRVLMETTAPVDSVALWRADERGDLVPLAHVGWEHLPGLGTGGFVGLPREVLKVGRAVGRSRLHGHELPEGVRALYGVPLLEGERAIGVAVMGSRTAYDFSAEDRQLLRVMAHRATDLLTRAQLARAEQNARDVAARTQSELAEVRHKLRQDESLLSHVLDVLPISVVVTDVEGRLLLNNRASRELWGELAAPPSRLGSVVATDPQTGRVVPPDEWPLERVLREGRSLGSQSLRITKPDGQARELIISAVPLVDEEGERWGAIALHQDVTDLARMHHQLRAEEERFRQVVDGMRDYAIFMLEPDGRIASWNPGARLVFGYEAHQIVGAYFARLFCREEVEAGTVEAVLKEAAEHGRVEGEGRRIRSDGTTFHAQFALGALHDLEGTLTGFAHVLHDETERKRVAELAEQNAKFQEQFVSILGHDLRNPLSAITASAEVLFRRGVQSEAHQKALARIASSANRMARMINDLLDLTRSRQGGLPISRRRTNLHELVQHVVEELEVSNPNRHIQLRAEGDGWGELDPDRMSQVISNLVANALEHGQADTPVEVVATGENGTLRLEVSNQGRPIPPELLPRLFDPYRRGPGSGRSQGLGLGLYIADQIVRSHGGNIEVRSTEAEGTKLTVRVPRR